MGKYGEESSNDKVRPKFNWGYSLFLFSHDVGQRQQSGD
jgi:hypothetical protein